MTMPGCSTISPVTSAPSGVIYQYDLIGTVNGYAFSGVGVIPYSPTGYDMKIMSKVNVDMLTIQTCSQDFSAQSAIELGWFQSKKGYEYKWTQNDIEKSGSCVVRLGAYNKPDVTQSAWGFLDFEDPSITMPALITCNGSQVYANGVSVCHNKIGLLGAIKFTSEMKWDSNGKCALTTTDNMLFTYSMPSNECSIRFMETHSPNRMHRMTLVPYNSTMIRGS